MLTDDRSVLAYGGQAVKHSLSFHQSPTPQGCMWTRRSARHSGHLLFAALRCTVASQPRQTACGQYQRHGGALECASCVGHGELNSSMHTEQSSPAHSGSGGAAGTHPWGSPPGARAGHRAKGGKEAQWLARQARGGGCCRSPSRASSGSIFFPLHDYTFWRKNTVTVTVTARLHRRATTTTRCRRSC